MTLPPARPNAGKRYFNTFDAMRFFAFSAVLLHHTRFLSIPGLECLQHSGGLSVSLFFTLSGFLITYTILEEKQRTGRLQLRHFFIRRILRIWPLFFLMVGFAYCTPYILRLAGISASGEGYAPDWRMSALFMENYKIILEEQLPNTSPLPVMWSLCVEEHFYILLGIVFYFMNIRHTPLFLAVSLVICFLARIGFLAMGWDTLDLSTNLDYFAYGAIPAYLLVCHGPTFERQVMRLKYRYKYALIGATAILFFAVPQLRLSPVVDCLVVNNLFGILFALIICFTIPSENRIKIGRKNLLSRLGKLSYGQYLYHTVVISFLLQLSKRLGVDLQQTASSAVFFIVALILVIVISQVSYQFFESKFLQLKNRF